MTNSYKIQKRVADGWRLVPGAIYRDGDTFQDPTGAWVLTARQATDLVLGRLRESFPEDEYRRAYGPN